MDDDADTKIAFTEDGKGKHTYKYPSIYHAEGYKPPVGGKEPIRFKKGEAVLVSEDNRNFYPRIFLFQRRNLFVCMSSENPDTDEVWTYCKKLDLNNYSGE